MVNIYYIGLYYIHPFEWIADMGQLSTSSTIVSKPRYIEFSPVGEIKPLTWVHFRPASPGRRLTKCGSSDRGN